MAGKSGLSCAITFDFDAMSSWIGSARSRNPSMISRGQFGAVALPRILALLEHFAAAGARFEPMGDYVARWRAENPLDAWKRANPDLTGAEALGP